MPDLWQLILEQLRTNNFLSGGAFLMVVGALGALARKWPSKIWDTLRSKFVTVVDIPDRDPAFQWVNDWLAVHPYGAEKARLLTVRTIRDTSDEAPDDDCDCEDCEALRASSRSTQPKIIFSPAPGSHYFFYRGRFVILNRTRKESESMSTGSGIRECFTITVFSRGRGVVTALLEEARELAHPKTDDRIAILVPEVYQPTWTTRSRVSPRSIESVVMPAGLVEGLLKQVKKFRRSSLWYLDRGIPWRLGIGFWGGPGGGKSSLALALASHFRLDIAILTLSSGTLTDDKLRDLLCTVPKNTLVLIEDIDRAFVERRAQKDKDNSVTFSGLLNAIDGVAAGEGRILVMTSNKPEKLDPALVRPGRVDISITVGLPDEDQRKRLYLRFFPDSDGQCLADKFAAAIEPTVSMAQIQGHLLKYSDSADKAMFHVDELEDLAPAVEAPSESQ